MASGGLPPRRAALRRRATSDLTPLVEELGAHEITEQRIFFGRVFQTLTYNGIEGDYAEFGCWGAKTFRAAWRASRMLGHGAHLWGFDSFEGLPASTDERDAHIGWTKGAMRMPEEEFVRTCLESGLDQDGFTTVPGFFNASLAPDAAGPRPERICFAYIDCDLYSSTIDVLRFVVPRLSHGAVIACDDYYCYSTTHPSGERLALAEVFADHPKWRLLPYLPMGWYGMSFVVEDRATAPPAPPAGPEFP
jgi:O-methyltransferase